MQHVLDKAGCNARATGVCGKSKATKKGLTRVRSHEECLKIHMSVPIKLEVVTPCWSTGRNEGDIWSTFNTFFFCKSTKHQVFAVSTDDEDMYV